MRKMQCQCELVSKDKERKGVFVYLGCGGEAVHKQLLVHHHTSS